MLNDDDYCDNCDIKKNGPIKVLKKGEPVLKNGEPVSVESCNWMTITDLGVDIWYECPVKQIVADGLSPSDKQRIEEWTRNDSAKNK